MVDEEGASPSAQRPVLTRREARALEAADAVGTSAAKYVAVYDPTSEVGLAAANVPPLTRVIVFPEAPAPREQPANADVRIGRRAAVSPRRSVSSRRISARAGRAVGSARTIRSRPTTFTSKLVSLGALVTAGALLVGSSVPVNAFLTDSGAVAAADAPAAAITSQTLRASAGALASVPVRDSFDVVSNPQASALKRAGVENSQGATSPVGQATPGSVSARPPTPEEASLATQVVALVNQQRATAGCGPVAEDAGLGAVALGHSVDMGVRNYFAHDTPEGVSPFQRAANAGLSASGENIAAGQPTAESVMRDWMNSEGHRNNILNCNHTKLGVGVAQGSGDYRIYWTQLFG